MANDFNLEVLIKGPTYEETTRVISAEEYRARTDPKIVDVLKGRTTIGNYLSRLPARIFFESIYGRIIRS